MTPGPLKVGCLSFPRILKAYEKLARLLDSNAVTTTDTFNIQGWLTSRAAVKGSGNNGTATNTFSEKAITYDRTGNVTKINRYDNAGAGTSLSYSYSGNRRSTFSYDLNGNVTSDATNSLQSSYNLRTNKRR